MFTVKEIGHYSTAGISGQIPAEANIIITLEDSAGNTVYCIRSHVDEAGGDDLVMIGPEAMRAAWERDDDEGIQEHAHMIMDIGPEGTVVEKACDGYDSVVVFSGEIMDGYLGAGYKYEEGQVLD